ncbi:hypothetical protein ACFQVA_18070 [Actinomadura keratinilytica]
MTDSDRLLRRYEALLGAVPQTVWTLSADGVVTTLVGGEVQEKLWHPGEDGSWTDAIHPKDRDGLERKWLRATRERTPWTPSCACARRAAAAATGTCGSSPPPSRTRLAGSSGSAASPTPRSTGGPGPARSCWPGWPRSRPPATSARRS